MFRVLTSRSLAMDQFSALGPACPLCGGNAFDWQIADEMVVEVGDARFQPRVCTECGNIQLLLTRVDELAA